jgi:PAS domain-containing protein
MRAEGPLERCTGATASAATTVATVATVATVDDLAHAPSRANDPGSGRSVIEAMQELVCLCDARGTATFRNPALQRLMGWSVEGRVDVPSLDVPSLPVEEHTAPLASLCPAAASATRMTCPCDGPR